MHCGYVCKVTQIRKHENADRLQIATFFGNDTVVSLDTHEGDIGVYFPSDLQLSKEYCEINNLVRKKDENGKEIGGYLDPDKRNIKAIRLRGEKSDGMFMPLASFNFCFEDSEAEKHMTVGETVTVVNGHEICQKYIPLTTNRTKNAGCIKKTKLFKTPYAPLFAEHIDTEQLAYNLESFHVGDEIDLTLKMHGTSQRTGYLPVLSGFKKTLFDRILHREGKPIYNYDYVSGTRRVVLENFDGDGFYGSNKFRNKHQEALAGKLNKGETVYYEVVGFTDSGAPIMANGKNDKLGKDFVKMYGKETVFSYGCTPDGKTYKYGCDEYGTFKVPVSETPISDMYVYRMTLTTEEGYVVEYPPEYVRYRCEQMGVKCVPVIGKGIITNKELIFMTTDGSTKRYRYKKSEGPGAAVMALAEEYCGGPDPIGKTHTREGVVVRIVNKPYIKVLKHKNFEFKVLEGIIKDSSDTPDMEEAQEVV